MTPRFWRYTAFQVPGWLVAIGGGWLAHRWFDVPIWVAGAALIGWIVKDYALYPFLGSAYETDYRPPITRLIGERGAATREMSPHGYVRVRGELWRARVDAVACVRRGGPIEVTDVDGTTLVVKPDRARSG